MAKIRVTGGPTPTDVKVFIDGQERRDVVAINFSADISELFISAEIVFAVEELDIAADVNVLSRLVYPGYTTTNAEMLLNQMEAAKEVLEARMIEGA